MRHLHILALVVVVVLFSTMPTADAFLFRFNIHRAASGGTADDGLSNFVASLINLLKPAAGRK